MSSTTSNNIDNDKNNMQTENIDQVSLQESDNNEPEKIMNEDLSNYYLQHVQSAIDENKNANIDLSKIHTGLEKILTIISEAFLSNLLKNSEFKLVNYNPADKNISDLAHKNINTLHEQGIIVYANKAAVNQHSKNKQQKPATQTDEEPQEIIQDFNAEDLAEDLKKDIYQRPSSAQKEFAQILNNKKTNFNLETTNQVQINQTQTNEQNVDIVSSLDVQVEKQKARMAAINEKITYKKVPKKVVQYDELENNQKEIWNNVFGKFHNKMVNENIQFDKIEKKVWEKIKALYNNGNFKDGFTPHSLPLGLIINQNTLYYDNNFNNKQLEFIKQEDNKSTISTLLGRPSFNPQEGSPLNYQGLYLQGASEEIKKLEPHWQKLWLYILDKEVESIGEAKPEQERYEFLANTFMQYHNYWQDAKYFSESDVKRINQFLQEEELKFEFKDGISFLNSLNLALYRSIDFKDTLENLNYAKTDFSSQGYFGYAIYGDQYSTKTIKPEFNGSVHVLPLMQVSKKEEHYPIKWGNITKKFAEIFNDATILKGDDDNVMKIDTNNGYDPKNKNLWSKSYSTSPTNFEDLDGNAKVNGSELPKYYIPKIDAELINEVNKENTSITPGETEKNYITKILKNIQDNVNIQLLLPENDHISIKKNNNEYVISLPIITYKTIGGKAETKVGCLKIYTKNFETDPSKIVTVSLEYGGALQFEDNNLKYFDINSEADKYPTDQNFYQAQLYGIRFAKYIKSKAISKQEKEEILGYKADRFVEPLYNINDVKFEKVEQFNDTNYSDIMCARLLSTLNDKITAEYQACLNKFNNLINNDNVLKNKAYYNLMKVMFFKIIVQKNSNLRENLADQADDFIKVMKSDKFLLKIQSDIGNIRSQEEVISSLNQKNKILNGDEQEFEVLLKLQDYLTKYLNLKESLSKLSLFKESGENIDLENALITPAQFIRYISIINQKELTDPDNLNKFAMLPQYQLFMALQVFAFSSKNNLILNAASNIFYQHSLKNENNELDSKRITIQALADSYTHPDLDERRELKFDIQDELTENTKYNLINTIKSAVKLNKSSIQEVRDHTLLYQKNSIAAILTSFTDLRNTEEAEYKWSKQEIFDITTARIQQIFELVDGINDQECLQKIIYNLAKINFAKHIEEQADSVKSDDKKFVTLVQISNLIKAIKEPLNNNELYNTEQIARLIQQELNIEIGVASTTLLEQEINKQFDKNIEELKKLITNIQTIINVNQSKNSPIIREIIEVESQIQKKLKLFYEEKQQVLDEKADVSNDDMEEVDDDGFQEKEVLKKQSIEEKVRLNLIGTQLIAVAHEKINQANNQNEATQQHQQKVEQTKKLTTEYCINSFDNIAKLKVRDNNTYQILINATYKNLKLLEEKEVQNGYNTYYTLHYKSQLTDINKATELKKKINELKKRKKEFTGDNKDGIQKEIKELRVSYNKIVDKIKAQAKEAALLSCETRIKPMSFAKVSIDRVNTLHALHQHGNEHLMYGLKRQLQVALASKKNNKLAELIQKLDNNINGFDIASFVELLRIFNKQNSINFEVAYNILLEVIKEQKIANGFKDIKFDKISFLASPPNPKLNGDYKLPIINYLSTSEIKDVIKALHNENTPTTIETLVKGKILAAGNKKIGNVITKLLNFSAQSSTVSIDLPDYFIEKVEPAIHDKADHHKFYNAFFNYCNNLENAEDIAAFITKIPDFEQKLMGNNLLIEAWLNNPPANGKISSADHKKYITAVTKFIEGENYYRDCPQYNNDTNYIYTLPTIDKIVDIFDSYNLDSYNLDKINALDYDPKQFIGGNYDKQDFIKNQYEEFLTWINKHEELSGEDKTSMLHSFYYINNICRYAKFGKVEKPLFYYTQTELNELALYYRQKLKNNPTDLQLNLEYLAVISAALVKTKGQFPFYNQIGAALLSLNRMITVNENGEKVLNNEFRLGIEIGTGQGKSNSLFIISQLASAHDHLVNLNSMNHLINRDYEEYKATHSLLGVEAVRLSSDMDLDKINEIYKNGGNNNIVTYSTNEENAHVQLRHAEQEWKQKSSPNDDYYRRDTSKILRINDEADKFYREESNVDYDLAHTEQVAVEHKYKKLIDFINLEVISLQVTNKDNIGKITQKAIITKINENIAIKREGNVEFKKLVSEFQKEFGTASYNSTLSTWIDNSFKALSQCTLYNSTDPTVSEPFILKNDCVRNISDNPAITKTAETAFAVPRTDNTQSLVQHENNISKYPSNSGGVQQFLHSMLDLALSVNKEDDYYDLADQKENIKQVLLKTNNAPSKIAQLFEKQQKPNRYFVGEVAKIIARSNIHSQTLEYRKQIDSSGTLDRYNTVIAEKLSIIKDEKLRKFLSEILGFEFIITERRTDAKQYISNPRFITAEGKLITNKTSESKNVITTQVKEIYKFLNDKSFSNHKVTSNSDKKYSSSVIMAKNNDRITEIFEGIRHEIKNNTNYNNTNYTHILVASGKEDATLYRIKNNRELEELSTLNKNELTTYVETNETNKTLIITSPSVMGRGDNLSKVSQMVIADFIPNEEQAFGRLKRDKDQVSEIAHIFDINILTQEFGHKKDFNKAKTIDEAGKVLNDIRTAYNEQESSKNAHLFFYHKIIKFYEDIIETKLHNLVDDVDATENQVMELQEFKKLFYNKLTEYEHELKEKLSQEGLKGSILSVQAKNGKLDNIKIEANISEIENRLEVLFKTSWQAREAQNEETQDKNITNIYLGYKEEFQEFKEQLKNKLAKIEPRAPQIKGNFSKLSKDIKPMIYARTQHIDQTYSLDGNIKGSKYIADERKLSLEYISFARFTQNLLRDNMQLAMQKEVCDLLENMEENHLKFKISLQDELPHAANRNSFEFLLNSYDKLGENNFSIIARNFVAKQDDDYFLSDYFLSDYFLSELTQDKELKNRKDILKCKAAIAAKTNSMINELNNDDDKEKAYQHKVYYNLLLQLKIEINRLKAKSNLLDNVDSKVDKLEVIIEKYKNSDPTNLLRGYKDKEQHLIDYLISEMHADHSSESLKEILEATTKKIGFGLSTFNHYLGFGTTSAQNVKALKKFYNEDGEKHLNWLERKYSNHRAIRVVFDNYHWAGALAITSAVSYYLLNNTKWGVIFRDKAATAIKFGATKLNKAVQFAYKKATEDILPAIGKMLSKAGNKVLEVTRINKLLQKFYDKFFVHLHNKLEPIIQKLPEVGKLLKQVKEQIMNSSILQKTSEELTKIVHKFADKFTSICHKLKLDHVGLQVACCLIIGTILAATSQFINREASMKQIL